MWPRSLTISSSSNTQYNANHIAEQQLINSKTALQNIDLTANTMRHWNRTVRFANDRLHATQQLNTGNRTMRNERHIKQFDSMVCSKTFVMI
jgi:hypothetical protein